MKNNASHDVLALVAFTLKHLDVCRIHLFYAVTDVFQQPSSLVWSFWNRSKINGYKPSFSRAFFLIWLATGPEKIVNLEHKNFTFSPSDCLLIVLRLRPSAPFRWTPGPQGCSPRHSSYATASNAPGRGCLIPHTDQRALKSPNPLTIFFEMTYF